MQLFEQEIRTADDVFAVRQRARQVAAMAGFETSDQVRLATALSELGRDLMTTANGGSVDFTVDVAQGELVVTCEGLAGVALDASPGVGAARRLLPSVELLPSSATTAERVEIRRSLAAPVTQREAAEMRARIHRLVVISPLDELRAQNRELLGALEELTARHHELTELNVELEQTNQGVMAMYGQLSEELETTNRGVVALYAELDEKTQRLEETTEARSRFLNNVSHELRSPVHSIVGLSRLLLEPDSVPLSEDQRRQVELVAATASELLDLVNQLLDLARAEFGRLEPEISRVDLLDLTTHVLDALRPLARPGVELSAEASEHIVALTDPKLLRQVVRNLVANALAFTNAGRVTVRIHRSGGDVALEVVDTGIGIAPEDVDKVFEEFFQVRGPHQAARRGTGLGLAYSRRVAALLGGGLTATSVVGRGSTFTLQLPDRLASPPDELGTPALALRRVLVVDDDPAFRATLRSMLQPCSEVVEEAADGVQALERLRHGRYDVVVLDLMMPNLDGYGVLTAMDDDPTLRDVPVIVVTSTDPSRTDAPRAAAVVAKRGLTAPELVSVIATHV